MIMTVPGHGHDWRFERTSWLYVCLGMTGGMHRRLNLVERGHRPVHKMQGRLRRGGREDRLRRRRRHRVQCKLYNTVYTFSISLIVNSPPVW